jgi:3-oxoacyl-[acyl-carrier-protein] synthase III
MTAIRVVSLGAYAPENKLTNADLEKMVDTDDAWITERTGIKERRIAPAGTESHDLAVEAARQCLHGTGRRPNLLVSSTCTPGRQCPYQASIVAQRLGLEGLAGFDVNAACTGMIYALELARGLMRSSPTRYRNVLITAGEKMSKFTDYHDRNTCVLFGDAASALLLSAEGEGPELLDVEVGLDARGSDLVSMGGPGDEFYFRQEGRQVFRFAVTIMGQMIDLMRERCGLQPQDPFYVVPHQANGRVIQSVAQAKGIPLDRFVVNLERYGNTSSASIGLALTEAAREGRFKDGDIVLLVGFGGGLSWGAAALRWHDLARQ